MEKQLSHLFDVPHGCTAIIIAAGSEYFCTEDPEHDGAHRVDGIPGYWWHGEVCDLDAPPNRIFWYPNT